ATSWESSRPGPRPDRPADSSPDPPPPRAGRRPPKGGALRRSRDKEDRTMKRRWNRIPRSRRVGLVLLTALVLATTAMAAGLSRQAALRSLTTITADATTAATRVDAPLPPAAQVLV